MGRSRQRLLRIAKVGFSPDWVATAFNNETLPATFSTIGSEIAEPLSISPSAASLYASQSQQFTATMPPACSGSGVTWSFSPTVGTLNSTGLYTAPASISTPLTVTITAASASDSTKFAAAVVTLQPSESITVAPTFVTLYGGESQQFTASVLNASNQNVTWWIACSAGTQSCGSVNANGLYTAPTSIASQLTVTLTIASQADPTKISTATLTLNPGLGTPSTTTAIGNALNLIGESICRRPHAAPVVSASPDQFPALSPNSVAVTVTGTVTDYSLLPGKSLTYTWSLLNGPAPVNFAQPTALSTQATFTAVGNYTLQFSANDGLLIGSAITHVTVAPPTVANNDALVITPSITGPVSVGSQVTVGLTLLGFLSGGQPPPIQLQVTGANPQSVTINPTGNLYTFTYFGANAGVDNIVALATICCFANLTSNTATVTWVLDQPRLTGSPVTGRFLTPGSIKRLLTAIPANCGDGSPTQGRPKAKPWKRFWQISMNWSCPGSATGTIRIFTPCSRSRLPDQEFLGRCSLRR